jgi:hypothetical protein
LHFFFLASAAAFFPFFLHFFLAVWAGASERGCPAAGDAPTTAPSSASARSDTTILLNNLSKQPEAMLQARKRRSSIAHQA